MSEMVGRNIRKMREAAGLQQTELARKIGVSNKTVSSWESGRTEPKIGVVEKICFALGCVKSDIVGGDSVKIPDIPIESAKVSNLTQEEQDLIDAYRLLNDDGKHVAQMFMNATATDPKYQKDGESLAEKAT